MRICILRTWKPVKFVSKCILIIMNIIIINIKAIVLYYDNNSLETRSLWKKWTERLDKHTPKTGEHVTGCHMTFHEYYSMCTYNMWKLKMPMCLMKLTWSHDRNNLIDLQELLHGSSFKSKLHVNGVVFVIIIMIL